MNTEAESLKDGVRTETICFGANSDLKDRGEI